jgi:hypothetical protein
MTGIATLYTTLRQRWQQFPLAFRMGTIVYLVTRLVYSLIAILALKLYSLSPVSPQPEVHNWLEAWLLAPWYRWDAEWFLSIARQGYNVADGRSAYYPLYPVLIRISGDLLGHNYLLSGLLVSIIALWVALVLLFTSVQRHYGERVARGTLIALALYPFYFFNMVYYADSLLLLFSVATFLAMETKHWGWTAIFASLAVLSKLPGLVLFGPIVWEFWQQRRRLVSGDSFALLAVPLTISAWTVVLRLIGTETLISDFSSPLGILTPILTPSYQVRFEQWLVWPWEGLRLAFQSIPPLWGKVMGLKVTLDLLITIFFTLVIPFTLRLRRTSYVIYVVSLYAMNLMLVMPSFPLADFPRRMMMAFPVFTVLAMLGQHRWVRQPLTFVGSSLSLVLSAFFVWWVWVG